MGRTTVGPCGALGDLLGNLGSGLLTKLLQQLAVDLAGLRSCPVLLVAPDGAFGQAPRRAVDRPWIEAKR